MYLLQGTELNQRYVIEGLLGHGGFGITYSAYDKVLNVRVAVKEYLPRQLATRGEGQTKVSVYSGDAREHYDYGLRKFMEEAQSVARFSHHPNIVSARDYFEANGTAYMVMEYVEGVTLKEYIEKKGGRISFEEAKGIMMPVMDALREVHQTGLLHRDISPDNVYITTSAQVKLLDFGAARYFAGEQSKSLSVILKPGYAPEEQYRTSGKQGSWTDVYAVGATIYKALTGKTPPDALDRKEEDTLEPPSRLGVDIPPQAEQALLQALGVTASQRFQTMGEFQQALLGGEPMTIGLPPGTVSFPASPEQGYPPVAPSPPSGTSASQSGTSPSHQAQIPARRGSSPAAIAAGIGGGVLCVALIIISIWYFGSHGLQQSPKDKFLQTGISSLQAQDYAKAQSALEKARDLAPNDPQIYLLLAKAYYGLKKFPEELKACKEALRLDPGNVEARYLLGLEYLRQGRKDLALVEYGQIKEKQPQELGKQLFAAIHPPTTQEVKNASDLLTKGIDYYKSQNYSQAEAALKKSLDLNPKEPKAYAYLGLTYAALKRLPDAIAAYRQALNLKPGSPEVYLSLGIAYDKSDKLDEALGAWKTAVRYKRDLWEAYYHLAATYWRRGQKDLASENYKILASKDPVQLKALQAKLPDLAQYASQVAAKPTPPPVPMAAAPSAAVAKDILARGKNYYQAKDYPKAREALAEVEKLTPKDAEVHYLLGLTFASLKSSSEALQEFRQAVTLKPEAYSWNSIGAELVRLDLNKEAAEALKEALVLNDRDVQARYQLGETYVKLGEIKKARETQKVLKDQEPEKAKQLQASINKKVRGGRSLERQIDDLANRIYQKRTGKTIGATPSPRTTSRSAPRKATTAVGSKPTPNVQFGFGPSTVRQR